MIKSKNSNNYLILGFALGFFILALFIHQRSSRPILEISKQDSAININRDFLRIFSLGNKRLLADLIWIQTLLESDLEHYKGPNKNSWMYHRFRTISELDPLFYENYHWGGMYLSIIKDDIEGAAEIYELGLGHFPYDYNLNYNSGFNYYYEIGDFKKGLEKLVKIENHPKTPIPIRFLINKLKFETSQDFDSAITFLKFNYENTQDEMLKDKLLKDIYALTAERDLECLNSKGANCQTRDAEGNSYVLKNGQYQAPKEFQPYRIHRK